MRVDDDNQESIEPITAEELKPELDAELAKRFSPEQLAAASERPQIPHGRGI